MLTRVQNTISQNGLHNFCTCVLQQRNHVIAKAQQHTCIHAIKPFIQGENKFRQTAMSFFLHRKSYDNLSVSKKQGTNETEKYIPTVCERSCAASFTFIFSHEEDMTWLSVNL